MYNQSSPTHTACCLKEKMVMRLIEKEIKKINV